MVNKYMLEITELQTIKSKSVKIKLFLSRYGDILGEYIEITLIICLLDKLCTSDDRRGLVVVGKR